ncbi:MAG: TVP38/TMEM64 family protein [Catonella sp.]|nr:TVP38/TMEM64 family protein [Catonella sp.]MDY6355996.1 TVP38/TMEM64 family protein [Catonella sp.]
MKNINERKKKIISVSFFVSAIVLMIIITILLAKPVAGLADHPEELREAVQKTGPVSVFGFIGLLILQVFAAVVPGGPFEIAAGYAFGLLPGAIICDIGMTLGGLLVFLLTRRFGIAFVELFFKPEEIEKAKFLKTTDRSRTVILLLFLIPGIPKDLMSYILGLTDLSIREFLLFSLVGRFPAILLSTLSGHALAGEKYGLFAGVLIGIMALTAVGMFWYRRVHSEKKKEDRQK